MIKLKGYLAKYKKMRGFLGMTNRARRVSRAFALLQSTAAAGFVSARVRFKALPLAGRLLLAILIVLGLTVGGERKPARACPDFCACETGYHSTLQSQMAAEAAATAAYITLMFEWHRQEFWGIWMWKFNIGNALMMWTNELTAAAMTEMFAIGSFFDAKHQLETQRLLQMKMADAQRDYRPDVGMCTIGTAARGLAQTSRRSEYTAQAIVTNQIGRLTSSRNSSGGAGAASDKDARIKQLKKRFCDAKDGGTVMGNAVCNPATGVLGRNRDVDFNLSVMEPLTINVDLTDDARTGPDADVIGLSANLYGHHVFPPFPDQLLTSERGQSYALDMRAIAAKRSVASFSFGSIVGMKAAGSAESEEDAKYLRAVLMQLGAHEDDVESYLGKRPSYYAQMELLTKKIYQSPEFYTNLYDAPASVARKGTAIRAIRLIQDMDKFNSVLRSEQSLSVLLELYIEDLQTEIVNSDGEQPR